MTSHYQSSGDNTDNHNASAQWQNMMRSCGDAWTPHEIQKAIIWNYQQVQNVETKYGEQPKTAPNGYTPLSGVVGNQERLRVSHILSIAREHERILHELLQYMTGTRGPIPQESLETLKVKLGLYNSQLINILDEMGWTGDTPMQGGTVTGSIMVYHPTVRIVDAIVGLTSDARVQGIRKGRECVAYLWRIHRDSGHYALCKEYLSLLNARNSGALFVLLYNCVWPSITKELGGEVPDTIILPSS